ncbi:MAG: hypothetical protein PSV40_09875 [Polaromonas sp.]|uniref:hypothetical protein n=1 Tax=Polaromonas sp. TaxID=1869339 RepID=UPI002489C03F|nr:hypothetical protein [Polaromonas sp.]MDI1269392.1 hypothetical protein [Polaromonas sp.]
MNAALSSTLLQKNDALAPRKFIDLKAANTSQIVRFPLEQFSLVYGLERNVKIWMPTLFADL